MGERSGRDGRPGDKEEDDLVQRSVKKPKGGGGDGDPSLDEEMVEKSTLDELVQDETMGEKPQANGRNVCTGSHLDANASPRPIAKQGRKTISYKDKLLVLNGEGGADSDEEDRREKQRQEEEEEDMMDTFMDEDSEDPL